MTFREAAEQASASIVDDIVEFVQQETHSYDRPALDAGMEYVRGLTIRHLGEPARSRVREHEKWGSTLTMTYPGTGAGRVLIIAHYDTVWPTGTLAQWGALRRERDGRSILSGPGILDMKAGLVQGIWALKFLRESGRPTPTVTFLFNGDEEIGSLASRPHIEEYARQADAVLVLEPTANGAVKTGRKGIGIFTITARGIEAHAGLDPAAGASAIHTLADIITRATAIADPSRGTTINVGLIEGGTGTNVSAGFARASVDIRVETADEMRRVDAAFAALRPIDQRVTLEIDQEWNRPPMGMTTPIAQLFDLVREGAATLGHVLKDAWVGGGSDANFVAALGVPVLCGMGAVGAGPHARHEFIYPDEVGLYTAITAEALARLASGAPAPRATRY